MTLFRQIAALISAIFVLIMRVVVWNDFRYSSLSLQGQMGTMAQDMATMMGVALANSGTATDPAAVDTFFNTVFDSGYLASIGLYSPQGDLLQIKSQEINVREVPDWFVSLVDFELPVGQSQVMSNWVQVGTLKLTLHPGYAYVLRRLIRQSQVGGSVAYLHHRRWSGGVVVGPQSDSQAPARG